MICTRCKADIPKGAKTCPGCGKPVMMTLKPLAPLNTDKEEIKEEINTVVETVENTVSEPVIENVETAPEVVETVVEEAAPTIEATVIEDTVETELSESEEIEYTPDEINEEDSQEDFSEDIYEEENVETEEAEEDEESTEKVEDTTKKLENEDTDYQEFIKTTTPPPTVDEVKEPYKDIPDYETVDTNSDEYYDPIPEINEEMEKLGKRNYVMAALFTIFAIIFLVLYFKFIL